MEILTQLTIDAQGQMIESWEDVWNDRAIARRTANRRIPSTVGTTRYEIVYIAGYAFQIWSEANAKRLNYSAKRALTVAKRNIERGREFPKMRDTTGNTREQKTGKELPLDTIGDALGKLAKNIIRAKRIRERDILSIQDTLRAMKETGKLDYADFQLLEMYYVGMTTREIGLEVGVSAMTISTRLQNLFSRIGTEHRKK